MPRIPIKTLPSDIRRRFEPSQLEREGAVVFPKKRNVLHYLLVLVSIAWLLILAVLAYDFRWSGLKLGILSFITLGCFLLLAHGLIEIIQHLRSNLDEGVIVSRHHVIDVGPSSIEINSLSDLNSIDYSHRYQDRNYKSSTITFSFEGKAKTIHFANREQAENDVDKIAHLKKLFIEATVRRDANYLKGGDAFDDFVASVEKSDSSLLRYVYIIATSLLFTAGFVFAAFSLNEYFDDKLSWESATTENRASSFRKYIQTHSNGRRLPEASERLKFFYDAAESRYRSALQSDHNEPAVESVSALLRYARDTHNYRVQVNFRRKADIPVDLVERVKKDFEVEKVLSLGETFTDAKMIERESSLFGVLVEAFGQVFPDDVLELTTECSGNCASFSVNYETSFLESIYYDTKEKKLPEKERTWSPGILINWKFLLSIPNEDKRYDFELESAPADTINYDSFGESDSTSKTIQELDQSSFYDAMVKSAFDDFRKHLLFELGVGPEPDHKLEVKEADQQTIK